MTTYEETSHTRQEINIKIKDQIQFLDYALVSMLWLTIEIES